MSLEGLGKDFLQFLSPYLGPYGCMLAMTCKYMKANVVVKKYRQITQFYECDGHLELLQWCFRHEWRIFLNAFIVPLSILKWKFKKGLHDPIHAFDVACSITGLNLDVLNYCIENRIVTGWYPSQRDSFVAIDYLYRRKDIELTMGIWEMGYEYDEEVYEWAYQYQSHEKISLRSGFRHDQNRILTHWINYRFKNTQMMINYLDLYRDYLTTIPRDTCNRMTYEISRAFNSRWCECGDPTNHENRKRIKI